MNNADSLPADPTYRIGAVSRLTGVAPETLLVWERRYGAVVPTRSEKGSRLYSQDDAGRLALIKRLVDSGDAISRLPTWTKSSWPSVRSARPCQSSGRGKKVSAALPCWAMR